MATLSFQGLRDLYDQTMAQADPRCDGYPLLDSPDKMLGLTGLYLLIVWLGPKWMANRKPWDLRTVIIIYNFALVILSSYTSLATLYGIYKAGGYSISCDSIDKYQTSGDNKTYVNVGYIFFLSKIIEFWDTFFFILRKKNRQITFLHVYHHALMTVFTWLGVKFLPGGSNIVYPLINSFIHAVMYTYYGLSAFGPGMAKYLWWKKYLTRMQISQFVIFLAQGFVNTYYDCPLPKVFVYAVYIYTFSILLLFINFYVRAYLAKQPRKGAGQESKKVEDTPKPHQNGSAVERNGKPHTNGTAATNGRPFTRSLANGKLASNGTLSENGDTRRRK